MSVDFKVCVWLQIWYLLAAWEVMWAGRSVDPPRSIIKRRSYWILPKVASRISKTVYLLGSPVCYFPHLCANSWWRCPHFENVFFSFFSFFLFSEVTPKSHFYIYSWFTLILYTLFSSRFKQKAHRKKLTVFLSFRSPVGTNKQYTLPLPPLSVLLTSSSESSQEWDSSPSPRPPLHVLT